MAKTTTFFCLLATFLIHFHGEVCAAEFWESSNLHERLKISPGASLEDIKSAYRKLAVQYHPDRNKDPGATEKFKEINEANDTLSDPQKRAQYDHMGSMGGGTHGQWHFHTNMGGGGGFEDIFQNIFRGGFPFGHGAPQRNADTTVQLSIGLEEAFQGKTIPVQFTDASGQNVNLQVTVPPGVENGTRLRYAGNGSRIHPNLAPGDLYVIIQIHPHPKFQRDGAHLFTETQINLWQSLMGTTVRVPTIEGGLMDLVVPPGTQPASMLRAKGKGMPTRQDRKMRGDLHVKINVTWPTVLTSEQQEMIRKWNS